MKTIIVEDSLIARQGLIGMLKEHPSIDIVGDAENVEDAIQLVINKNPDLIFLDIQLPGMSGFDLLEKIDYSPKVIFTTAYSEYAIRSFDYNTVDYLLKPIRHERLHQSIEKASHDNKHEKNLDALESDSQIFIKDGENCHLIALTEIHLFESCKNHTRVYFNHEKPFIRRSLSKIEERLPPHIFFRINRQQIINLSFVKTIEEWMNDSYRVVMQDDTILEVSRRHSLRLKTALSF